MKNWSENDAENRNIISLALMNNWDPIGVSGFDGAEDEYDMYVGDIFYILNNNPDIDKIFDYLWNLETIHMGLPGDKRATLNFSELLLEFSRSKYKKS